MRLKPETRPLDHPLLFYPPQQLHVDEANRALSQLELREARLDGNAAMIDLEDDFMDEERHAEGILELSPAQHAAPPARPRSALPAAGALPPPPRVGDNLEKIKVGHYLGGRFGRTTFARENFSEPCTCKVSSTFQTSARVIVRT